jgi:hypothetical protein
LSGQVWDECNPLTKRANCLLQVDAFGAYIPYYASYEVVRFRNDVASDVGGVGGVAIHVGTLPLDLVAVPVQAVYLGADVGFDVVKNKTIPGNNESIWDEGVTSYILPVCNCGPQAYLPGLNPYTGQIELAGPWGNTIDPPDLLGP